MKAKLFDFILILLWNIIIFNIQPILYLFIKQMKDGISLFVGLVYSLNIAIGSGFLNLPYSFKESGILLSLLYMVLFSVVSNYLSIIFLEVIHKGCLIKLENEKRYRNMSSLEKSSRPSENLSKPPKTEIDDISIVFQNIFGHNFGILYLSLITIYFEGSLLTYSSIFASSFSSNVPLFYLPTCDIYEQGFYSKCIFNYWIYLGIFSCSVVYLSLKGMKDQKTFQIIMCGMRFLIISLIIFCCLHIIITGKSFDGKDAYEPEPLLVNMDKGYDVVPIIVFSLMYQLLLPSIAALVRKRKENMWKIILFVTLIIGSLYGALGAVVPYAVGNVKEQITLNFRDYTAGNPSKNYWCHFVSYSVILLPALDVVSCYPFKAISLADNWANMIYGKDKSSKKMVKIFTLISAVIPLILAAVFYNIVNFI
jgi:amino acid permease